MGAHRDAVASLDTVKVESAKIETAHRATQAAELTEATQQVSFMAADLRLLSARVETLRSVVESRQTVESERALKKSVDTLRSGLEQSKQETARVLSQMAQKLDHLPHDPGAKLAQIADRLDHLERRSAAAGDVTGSIAKPSASASVAASPPKAVAVQKNVEGTKPAKATATALPGPKIILPTSLTDAKPQPKILSGFVLRDIEGDVAIVEGRGQIFEVARGDTVPGMGRVESIERRGREWMVVTSRGLIGTRARD